MRLRGSWSQAVVSLPRWIRSIRRHAPATATCSFWTQACRPHPDLQVGPRFGAWSTICSNNHVFAPGVCCSSGCASASRVRCACLRNLLLQRSPRCSWTRGSSEIEAPAGESSADPLAESFPVPAGQAVWCCFADSGTEVPARHPPSQRGVTTARTVIVRLMLRDGRQSMEGGSVPSGFSGQAVNGSTQQSRGQLR